MKRLYIIAEGQTEQTFINNILSPYLMYFGHYWRVSPILIRTSSTGKGGFVDFNHLKYTINSVLRKSNRNDYVVSTMVDFFRIPRNLPKYQESMAKSTRIEQVSSLEYAMGDFFADRRFIPYIQLHEFEALLFSSNRGFEYFWDEEKCEQTKEIMNQ